MNVSMDQMTAPRDVRTSRTVICRFGFDTSYTLPAYTDVSLQQYSATNYEIYINRMPFAE